MEEIKIRALGVGAVEIKTCRNRIFVDAQNSFNETEILDEGDILIFTHDDADHFDASKLQNIKDLNIKIIGPPSIVKPIIKEDKARIDQIVAIYSQNNNNPASIEFDEIIITSLTTPHFNHWNAIHNSYLIQIKNRRVFVTGDSLLTKEVSELIGNIDVAICNLVDEGYLTGKGEPRHAFHHLLSYLLSIMSDCKPGRIIGTHLINFDGTVDAKTLKKLIEDYQFSNIIIPIATDEIICI